MLNFAKFTLFSMGLSILSITEAFAAVTAQQVWSDLRQKLTANRFQIRVTEFRKDDTLTLSDLMVSYDLPQAEGLGSVSLTLETVQFVDNLDGTVKIVFPDIMPVTLVLKDSIGGAVDLQLDVTQSDLEISVSGQGQDRRYRYGAQSLGLKLRKLLLDGIELPETAANSMLSLSMIRGSSIQGKSTLHQFNQVLSLDEFAYEANIAVPDAPTHFSGKLSNFSFTGNALLPLSVRWTSPLGFIAAGAQGNGNWESGASQSAFSTVKNGKKIEYSTQTAAGSGTVALNKEQFLYRGESSGLEMFLLLDTLPFPISVSLSKVAADLLLPLAASPQAEPFGFGILLSNLVMSDMLWSLFDADDILPRDPLSVGLDISGTLKILSDLFSPDALTKFLNPKYTPLELESLSVDRFELSGADTSLSAVGGFTFDNSDLETFSGFPRPLGKIEAKLIGGHGLLDRLITIGLLSNNEAMGVRMMMGMFTVPGVGDDVLDTVLEVTQKGQFLANGQRIR
jgi:hypothetical protein